MPTSTKLHDVEYGLRDKYDKLAQRFQEIGSLPYFYVYPALESVIINAQPKK
jgi:hypothetical protein